MAIREVLQMGHPLLREKARPIEPKEIASERLENLLKDMVDTLHDKGGIGLAAPQIGESLSLAIIEIEGGPSRYGELESIPLSVFINPKIEILNPAVEGYWEGCLSVSGLRGFVERPQHIRVSFTQQSGGFAEMELKGFLATVFQHEFDHLDGKLFIDRMTDTHLLSFEKEYQQFHL
ncbi:MAG: peptide deformylase [Pseudomonadota bacterium]|nr:peptide deformylase [Pseudomonadota bacterium]